MKMKEKIKNYYTKELWTIDMVRDAVHKGKITQAEFLEITGVEFENKDIQLGGDSVEA